MATGKRFRAGTLVPRWGKVVRVVSADVHNGHLCYRVEDPEGKRNIVGFVQHTEILAEMASMAKYQVNDRFRAHGGRGSYQWIKERKWDGRAGVVQYRLNDYWEEGRWPTWCTQAELEQQYEHLGHGMTEPK